MDFSELFLHKIIKKNNQKSIKRNQLPKTKTIRKTPLFKNITQSKQKRVKKIKKGFQMT